MNLLRALLAVSLSFAAPLAAAQWSPTKPVRIVVPFPAGGIVDLMARTLNDKLGTQLGQPVLVEARPGAMSSIGTEAVAKSEPDGHTLLLATISHATLPWMTTVPWHPVNDFAGVALIGEVANIAVVPASLAPKTMAEFVTWARERPGKVNYINAGFGTSQTLTVELFRRNHRLEFVPIGYKGYPPAMPDLIHGQIQFSVAPFGVALPHVMAGKLRGLAVLSASRNKQLPGVPTFAEAGFAESVVVSWYMIVAPAATPRPAIERLNLEFTRAMADPEVLARIEKVGGAPLPTGTAAEAQAMLVRESARWGKFIRESGLKIE